MVVPLKMISVDNVINLVSINVPLEWISSCNNSAAFFPISFPFWFILVNLGVIKDENSNQNNQL